MARIVIIIIMLVVTRDSTAWAQHTPDAAYAKFLQLTQIFHGKEAYACDAIVEVKYSAASNIHRDTSKLIYKNSSTFYKSRVVEHVEAPQGELIINHELKTAVFTISDSIRQVVQKELDVEANRELEAMLDSNVETRNEKAFADYMVKECKVVWANKGDLDEIVFTPKNPANALFVSMKIRFSKDSRIRYYEYTNREAYATDMNARTKYRVVTTIYDHFNYHNVPNIPSKLTDFLAWNGWNIKLKRYTNYQLSIL